MSNLTFPEVFKVVQAHEPAIGSALLNTSDIVSCKNLKKLWAVLSMTYVDDVDLVVTWNESTDVAGGTTSAITAVCPIWYNIDTATADLLTRATDAITFTIDTGLNKNNCGLWNGTLQSSRLDMIVFRSECPAPVQVLSMFLYIGEPRYQSDVVGTAITD
jgi:hypothetical protein